MSQQPLFEGWAIQRTTIDLPGYGKISINPEEPPHGFEALCPNGRLPAYHDVAEVHGFMQVSEVRGGSGVDKETGTADSEFERVCKFVFLRREFQVLSLQPYRETQERDTA